MSTKTQYLGVYVSRRTGKRRTALFSTKAEAKQYARTGKKA